MDGYSYIVKSWGNYSELIPQGLTRPAPMKGGDRGDIRGQSVRSRMRLISNLNKLKVELVAMITLTYEDDSCGGLFPLDWIRGLDPVDSPVISSFEVCQTKLHLNGFLNWLRRRSILCVWWMEFTGRGRPHFHLLLDREPDDVQWKSVRRSGHPTKVCCDTGFGRAIATEWMRIAKQNRSSFHRGGILELLRCPEGGIRYAAKEGAKRAQKIPPRASCTGRMWGIPFQWMNREPEHEVQVLLTGKPRFKQLFDSRFSMVGGVWTLENAECSEPIPEGFASFSMQKPEN